MTTKPDSTYTVLPDGRVKITNARGQTMPPLNRAQVVKALAAQTLTAELRAKYTGALAALDGADRKAQAKMADYGGEKA